VLLWVHPGLVELWGPTLDYYKRGYDSQVMEPGAVVPPKASEPADKKSLVLEWALYTSPDENPANALPSYAPTNDVVYRPVLFGIAISQRPPSAQEFENGAWTMARVGPPWWFGRSPIELPSKAALYDPDVIRPYVE
jgi:hypothetical protein